MKEMSVIGYPTFVALNDGGATLNRWIGFDKDMFLGNALAVAEDPMTIEEKLTRYGDEPTADDAVMLAGYRDSRGEYVEAVGLYRDAEKMDPERDLAMPVFESTFYAVRREQLPVEDLTAAADAVFEPESPEPFDMLTTAMMMAYMGRRLEDATMGTPYIKAAIERTEDSPDEDVQQERKSLLPDYALQVLEDSDKAVAYKKASMDEGWMDDPGALNGFAWWCFSNGINLEEARDMAARGVELAEPGSEKAQILDTLAEICHARGDDQAAVAHMKAAIEQDPDSESYRKQLERFEEAAGGGSGSSK